MKADKTSKPLMLLDAAEMAQINGGASGDSASMSLSTGTDSLLSIGFTWQQGDSYKHYELTAGKDVHFDLNAFGSGAAM